MNSANQNYCIKADYQPNPIPATFTEAADPNYWTPERIATATRYQYDVYVAAAALMRTPTVASVLDVGSGPPKKLKSLLPNKPLRLHLVDQPQTEAHATELLPNAAFTAANLEDIAIDLGERFDLVICADVIEHLLNPDPCLQFIRRHMSSNGVLVISTPERDILRGRDCRSCPHPMHVREWNRHEFREFLQSRGWQVLDQRIFPQQRVAAPIKALGRCLDQLGYAPRWYSCQMVLCRTE